MVKKTINTGDSDLTQAEKKVAKKAAKKTVKKTAKKSAVKKVTKATTDKSMPTKKAFGKKTMSESTKKAMLIEAEEQAFQDAAAKKAGHYKLVIVESPSKAKTIKKYLGPGFQVIASNGHIKDLPKSKLGVDIKNDFALDIVPIAGKKDKIDRIKDLAKYADGIYLAPDPDREGEAIAYHIYEEIGKTKTPVHRVMFNSITKTAVQEAMNNPLKLDEKKYDSQRTRRVLDRLVGYKISPILWEKVQRGLSAGRVQSVALRIIVEREDEVTTFIPEQWFSIHAFFEKDKIPFEAKFWSHVGVNKKIELKTIEEAQKIVQDTAGKQFTITDVKQKERKQNPTPPFTTSKLQQEAANKLGFTAKRTMMVAQKLYEGIDISGQGVNGLITYMRTDSVRIAPEALEAARSFILNNYGQEYLPAEAKLYSNKKKNQSNVQDAHEAIRPTNLEFTPELLKGDLEADEWKLYSLIWNKFIASQMQEAILDQTAVTLICENHIFRANGSIIKFLGFRKVYMETQNEVVKSKLEENETAENQESSESEESLHTPTGLLPILAVEEKIAAKDGPKSEEHWTAPPPRYSEASLVKELEERGIGRPSTYAAIISNIQDRGYVVKQENRFNPTELGIVISRLLVQSFPEVMDIEFTAKVEELLDKIEEGEVKWKKVLRDFWSGFEKTLERAKEEMKDLKKQVIPTDVHCLKCETGMYNIKWGKNGQFFACSNYPDCNSTEDFVKHLNGSFEIIPKEYAKENCPECKSRLIVKKGKYGRFFACENYPACKTALPFTIDVTCPECKKGKFAEKKSRFGKIFYGCTEYPDCATALWQMPVNIACKACAYPVVTEHTTKTHGAHHLCPK